MTHQLSLDGGAAASGAVLSQDRRYRYALWRAWEPAAQAVLFVGLNPSTADENTDDPTIRRCIGFAKSWGYGGLVMGNVFAYRATDPREMAALNERVAIGPANDETLRTLAESAGLVVAAWGAHLRGRPEREMRVLELIGPEVHCLGLTNDGHPRHPLYLRGDTEPQIFARAA